MTKTHKPMSQERRQQIRLQKLGKKRPDMVGNKWAYKRKHSEEARKKISIAQIGKVVSAETRMKISKALLGNHHKTTRIYVLYPREQIKCPVCSEIFFALPCLHRKYCSKSCSSKDKNFIPSEKHPYWKGNYVGYSGIHKWIRKNYGEKPAFCEECGILGKMEKRSWSIQYANISGEYKRERKDWIPVCRKCHKRIYNTKSNKLITVGKELFFKHEKRILRLET